VFPVPITRRKKRWHVVTDVAVGIPKMRWIPARDMAITALVSAVLGVMRTIGMTKKQKKQQTPKENTKNFPFPKRICLLSDQDLPHSQNAFSSQCVD
jgi:hypothetical protein